MRLLRRSIPAAVDYYGVDPDPEEPDSPGASYYGLLLYARYRALGLPAVVVDEGSPMPPEVGDQVVADFLAAKSDGLPDVEAAKELIRHLATFGFELDALRPVRVSPVKTAGFLLAYVPEVANLSDQAISAVPTVMEAWTEWVADQRKLPIEAVRTLRSELTEVLAEFAKAHRK
ncbi:hypothetical protein [Fodinicola feengrottensis]|uniref:hypothetical protein n=1 Tax=Fodinicola feengrottensis TaxID=435914 RepID=UPI0013CF4D69|nr:hypothetical protein [Fodinicola feengrottensis]